MTEKNLNTTEELEEQRTDVSMEIEQAVEVHQENAEAEDKIINLNEVIDKEENTDNTSKTKKTVPLPEINPDEVPIINYDDFKPIFKFDNLSDEQICEGAMNRLTQDTYFGINGLPLIACWLWVYNKAREDVNFAKQICIKSKCFNKAFSYLKKEIQALGGDGGCGVDHRQIFAVLEEYYYLDDAAIAEKEALRKKELAEKAKAEKAEKAKNANASKKKSSDKTTKKSKSQKAKSEETSERKAEKEKEAQMNFLELLGG